MQRRQCQSAALVLAFYLRTDLTGIIDAGAVLINIFQNTLFSELVGQRRYASGIGAGPKRNYHLAFAPQQARPFLLLGGAHGAVDEAGHDGLIRPGFDIGPLEIHGHGPEHYIHGFHDFQDILGQVHHGFFAAAAGSAPIKSYFGFIWHVSSPLF